MYENKDLFDFMLKRVREVGSAYGLKGPQSFGRWFAEMFFPQQLDLFISDGSGDGKVDLFFSTTGGSTAEHCILNTKFTEKYNALAPVSFYNEITAFWQAFSNAGNRGAYLENIVRPDLRPRYKRLFKYFDENRAQLYFLTNSRRNDTQMHAIADCGVQVFHLEDVLQFMTDYIEEAMPRTATLLLTGINTVLSAGADESEVPTSIVFARLTDFISYMEDDPYGLLFARNVRYSLGNTPVNLEIRDTFTDKPKEFAFSNNGITILAEKLDHVPGAHEVRIANPRIVNGSQTLHSIRDVPRPSQSARVMVRIIEIPRLDPRDLTAGAAKRKDIIHKISIRSNRQNDIKKWDLVSNDSFQLDIARYFRGKKLYYERRRKEWSLRRTDLKNLGIKKGPEIKGLAQLVSSFYWDRKLLGPVIAKSSVGELFDGKQYDLLKQIAPEIAYQLFLLDIIVRDCVNNLGDKKQYIYNMATHMHFALFSLLTRILTGANASWGSSELAQVFEAEIETATGTWTKLVKKAIDQITGCYKTEAKRYKRRHGQTLPYNNYFKSQTNINRILQAPVPRQTAALARAVLP